MVNKTFCTDIASITDPKVFLEGQILLVDKPLNWTSFDVVNKIRRTLCRLLQVKKLKVGHAGTLDPLATGLMIVCTGKATKKIEHLMGFDKWYQASVKFGATTPSLDMETEEDQAFPFAHINAALIEQTLQQFEGEQQQVPPHFSAIKIGGRKAYEMARKGKSIELKSRTVHFHHLKLIDYADTEANIVIHCSKGTYIRSFARDLGAALNSGGHLTALRRTGIGSLQVENAMTIENFQKNIEQIETL